MSYEVVFFRRARFGTTRADTAQRALATGLKPRVKNRITAVGETGNIKITSVASKLFGLSGRKMLDSLTRGDRDAGWMADFHVVDCQEETHVP